MDIRNYQNPQKFNEQTYPMVQLLLKTQNTDIPYN